MEYRTEPLCRKNLSDLKFLYRKVFGNDYSMSFIEKKYNTEFLHKSYFGHLAYDQNIPIAFHGAIPVRMRYKDKYEIAAQYGDAMTLSEYNGQGLFTKLGSLTDEKLVTEGIRFVWGFPNQNSEYGYLNKMGWKYTERMQCFKLNISPISIEKSFRQISMVSKSYDIYIEWVFRKFKTSRRITGSVYTLENVVSTARDDEYYKYKSFTNNFTIEIDNVLIWLKIRNGLYIGDIQAHSRADFELALDKLQNIAKKNGIREIIIQCSPNTMIEHFMQEIPTLKQETWIVGYKNFDSKFPLEKLKFTLGDLDTF